MMKVEVACDRYLTVEGQQAHRWNKGTGLTGQLATGDTCTIIPKMSLDLIADSAQQILRRQGGWRVVIELDDVRDTFPISRRLYGSFVRVKDVYQEVAVLDSHHRPW